MTTYTYDEHLAAYPDLDTATRQRLGVEPSGRPLDDDGIAGPKTRGGIYIAPRAAHKLVDAYLRLALLNAREEGSNNSGRWPALMMGQKELRGFTPEDIVAMSEGGVAFWSKIKQGPFCAGAASTAIRLAYGDGQPQSLGAKQLGRRWAAKPGEIVRLDDAQPGDLVIWHRVAASGNPAAGHIGVCAGRANGMILTLEGNGSRRNGAVGLYGYSLREGAKRGTQLIVMLARRADT